MSKRFWSHLGFLFLATWLTWVWVESPELSFYTGQLIALLVLVYFGQRFFFRRGSKNQPLALAKLTRRIASLDGVVLTSVVLLLIFSTGGAASPLFFLIYFLLFGLAFVWEPLVVLFFSLFLTVFLLLSAKTLDQTILLNSLSVIFIAPLSLFFGKEYLNNLAAQKRIKIYQQKWSEDEKHLENQETQILFWLATKLKPNVIEILDKISQLLADISHLTEEQKKHLKRIRRLSNELLRSGEKLKRSVDLETD